MKRFFLAVLAPFFYYCGLCQPRDISKLARETEEEIIRKDFNSTYKDTIDKKTFHSKAFRDSVKIFVVRDVLKLAKDSHSDRIVVYFNIHDVKRQRVRIYNVSDFE